MATARTDIRVPGAASRRWKMVPSGKRYRHTAASITSGNAKVLAGQRIQFDQLFAGNHMLPVGWSGERTPQIIPCSFGDSADAWKIDVVFKLASGSSLDIRAVATNRSSSRLRVGVADMRGRQRGTGLQGSAIPHGQRRPAKRGHSWVENAL